jgi:integrase
VTNELVPSGYREPTVMSVLEEYERRRSPRTLQSYNEGLAAFATFIGVADAKELAVTLLRIGGKPSAQDAITRFRDYLRKGGYAANTINLRLAAVRALLRIGRRAGLIEWDVDVEGEKEQLTRDTHGPGFAAVEKTIELVSKKFSKFLAARDTAIIRLLLYLARRKFEVQTLDLNHYDVGAKTLSIRSKGAGDARKVVALPKIVSGSLDVWVALRGVGAGPMFLSRNGGRLSGSQMWRIVHDAGLRAGVDLWPHACRHAFVERARELGIEDRKIQSVTGHKDQKTLARYGREDKKVAVEVSCIVAGEVGKE